MGYAADTYAKITREQYQDWKTRFYPKQQELMELANNGQLLREQLGRWTRTTPTLCVRPSRPRPTAMREWGWAPLAMPTITAKGCAWR